jgi:dihydroorotate dehydrogenase electron transfer subunit
MKHLCEARVVGVAQLTENHYVTYLEAPAIAEEACPGQFVMVRPLAPTTLLPRPLGISRVGRTQGRIALLIRVRGSGTHSLVTQAAERTLLVWGPLGRGYTMPASGDEIVLVAGGYGIAPLVFMTEESVRAGARVTVVIGASTARRIVAEDVMRRAGARVQVATEDGSAGFPGLASGAAAEALGPKTTRLHACGPLGMLRAIAELCAQRGIECEVSMEERMACGVGACMGCPIPVVSGGYKMACSDGPVFAASQVDWTRLEVAHGGA